ncbi:hypothetical protein HQ520_01350, partial [bacterium]|nr:hypothetical protein [bacterium]
MSGSILGISDLRKARALCLKGHLEEARERIGTDVQIAKGEKPFTFWREAAVLARDLGMTKLAEHAWNEAGRAGLDARVVRLEKAVNRLVAGDFEAAKDMLTEAIEAEPRNAVLRNAWAIALFESAETARALEEWETNRRWSAQKRGCPLSTDPLYLALAAMALEGFLQSRSTKPVREAPEETHPADGERAPGRTRDSRLARIERALARRDFDLALGWIENEMRGEEREPDMLNLMYAVALSEKDRWGRAREELATVLERSEGNSAAQSYLGYCLARAGAPDAALRVLESVQPVGPDDYFVHYFRGIAWLE